MIESETGNQTATSNADRTRHWGLRLDPFAEAPATYVATPTHDEAISRLSHLIESGQSLGLLSGESGLGKSTVLRRISSRLRSPIRRFVPIPGPLDGEDVVAALRRSLELPSTRAECSSTGAWRSLESRLRLQGWQRTHLVLLVDDCRNLMNPSESPHLKRLLSLGMGGRPRITVILTTDDEPSVREHPEFRDALPARLKPLTRSESAHYLAAKLQAGGRTDETFTPRAITRIHALGAGIPRTLDRLASLSLMAGARQGLEMITPDIVDAIARELWPVAV